MESAEGVSPDLCECTTPGLTNRFIPLPKSDTKERIIANRDIFDFELSQAQMDKLDALDQDEHVCLNPTECP